MRIIKTKKGLALLAVLVVAAVAAIGGYAYFNSTGAGNGSATVATTNGITFLITGNASGAVAPGGQSAISGNVHNGGTQAAGLVGPITGTVSLDSSNSASVLANCSAADFSIDPQNVPAGTTIAANGDYPFTTALHMANTGSDQSACKGAALDITWAG